MPNPEIEERQRQVKTLFLARRSEAEIAKTLGITRKTVAADLKALREDWDGEGIDEDLERLAALERALWPAAMAGKWLAADRCLLIIAERSRLRDLAPKPQQKDRLDELADRRAARLARRPAAQG